MQNNEVGPLPTLCTKVRKDQRPERKIQRAMIDIKKKFGKNAILKGMNLEEGATTMARNQQTGGHRSGSGKVEKTVYVNGPNGVKIAKD